MLPSPISFLPLLLLLLPPPPQSFAQQSYVNNKQLNCENNDTSTLGFLCNAPSTSCPSFLTFRSTPTYNSPVTIAYLLSADSSLISAANNISDVDPLPDDTLVIVPLNCSCSVHHHYYQHNASYVLKHNGETYFTVANNTYQSLTTCQSMISQNPNYNYRRLYPEIKLNVPLRCACPTPVQRSAGFNYLLTYLIRRGDAYDSIAAAFAGAGADVPSILYANNLTADRLIFFFTPILVPLRTPPTIENTNTVATPPQDSSPPPPTTPAPRSSDSSSRNWVFIGVGVMLLFSSLFLVWFFCFRRRGVKTPLPEHQAAQPPSSTLSSQGIQSAIESLTVYKFEELEKATGAFAESNRINGSSVYLGSFKGDDAVVKIMKGDVSREIDALRKINHSHIVRLSGFCLHQGITYLVYEYAENGSLTEWLRPGSEIVIKSDDKYSERRLDWKRRVQVAYDLADALNYLHNFTNPPYIHKNLKSTNILLDGNMRAKVANFGLSRTLDSNDQAVMTRHVVGTYGYMAPEYIESGLITPKLDVFALGVVMLELLSGREPIANEKKDEEKGDELLLCESIKGVLDGDNVRESLRAFMDPWLGEEYPLEMAHAMAEVARSCVASNVDARPSVSEVLIALSKLLSSSLDWDPSHGTSISLNDYDKE